MSSKLTLCLIIGSLLVACSTGHKKRLEMREKAAAASGMFCEFISGDIHNDIDIELNLQMARRCDPEKPFNMTNYKNSSENFGVIYCCSLQKDEEEKAAEANKTAKKAEPIKNPEDMLELDEDEKLPPGQKLSPEQKPSINKEQPRVQKPTSQRPRRRTSPIADRNRPTQQSSQSRGVSSPSSATPSSQPLRGSPSSSSVTSPSSAKPAQAPAQKPTPQQVRPSASQPETGGIIGN